MTADPSSDPAAWVLPVVVLLVAVAAGALEISWPWLVARYGMRAVRHLAGVTAWIEGGLKGWHARRRDLLDDLADEGSPADQFRSALGLLLIGAPKDRLTRVVHVVRRVGFGNVAAYAGMVYVFGGMIIAVLYYGGTRGWLFLLGVLFLGAAFGVARSARALHRIRIRALANSIFFMCVGGPFGLGFLLFLHYGGTRGWLFLLGVLFLGAAFGVARSGRALHRIRISVLANSVSILYLAGLSGFGFLGVDVGKTIYAAFIADGIRPGTSIMFLVGVTVYFASMACLLSVGALTSSLLDHVKPVEPHGEDSMPPTAGAGRDRQAKLAWGDAAQYSAPDPYDLPGPGEGVEVRPTTTIA